VELQLANNGTYDNTCGTAEKIMLFFIVVAIIIFIIVNWDND